MAWEELADRHGVSGSGTGVNGLSDGLNGKAPKKCFGQYFTVAVGGGAKGTLSEWPNQHCYLEDLIWQEIVSGPGKR